MDKKKENNQKKERIGQSIKIKSYDDIFDDEVKNARKKEETDGKPDGTVMLSPSKLMDFKNHPFKVYGKGIDELLESIREHGILSPIIVRPALSGGYEIISGHRRKYCAVELCIDVVPVLIRDIDDDEAVLAMVDSNIQREDILPSEKAFAYKMKLEAIKRQGVRTDLTCGQVVDKLKSADKVGKENNESGRQIQRYIRLTELPKSIIGAIDGKKMSFNAGVELSFLKDEDKKTLEEATAEIRRFPSLAQAKKLRDMSNRGGEFTVEGVIDILTEKKEKTPETDAVNLEREEIRAFFPKEFTASQIEEEIIKILNIQIKNKL